MSIFYGQSSRADHSQNSVYMCNVINTGCVDDFCFGHLIMNILNVKIVTFQRVLNWNWGRRGVGKSLKTYFVNNKNGYGQVLSSLHTGADKVRVLLKNIITYMNYIWKQRKYKNKWRERRKKQRQNKRKEKANKRKRDENEWRDRLKEMKRRVRERE